MAHTFDGREDERNEMDGMLADAGAAETDAPNRPTDSDESETTAPPTDELTPRRRARRPAARQRTARREGGEPVLALPLRKTLSDQVDELQAQGFTEEEAVRLISVSERMAHSGEARESEEQLRRLNFTRWLVEHGVLDEFSA